MSKAEGSISARLAAGEVLILVAKQADSGIASGSGIVTRVAEEGFADVYYEGNQYGAANLVTFEQRAYHAWGRMKAKYPTAASMRLSLADLDAEFVAVGVIADPDGPISQQQVRVSDAMLQMVWNWCS